MLYWCSSLHNQLPLSSMSNKRKLSSRSGQNSSKRRVNNVEMSGRKKWGKYSSGSSVSLVFEHKGGCEQGTANRLQTRMNSSYGLAFKRSLTAVSMIVTVYCPSSSAATFVRRFFKFILYIFFHCCISFFLFPYNSPLLFFKFRLTKKP